MTFHPQEEAVSLLGSCLVASRPVGNILLRLMGGKERWLN